MKMIIDNYEVNITVKRRFEDRPSKESAQYFLNSIGTLANEARKNLDKEGFKALSKWAEGFFNDIYDQLKADGFYDEG